MLPRTPGRSVSFAPEQAPPTNRRIVTMSNFVPFSRKRLRDVAALREEEINAHLNLGKLPVSEAGRIWLVSRRPFLAPRTHKDYGLLVKRIAKFFGDMPLEELANLDLIRLLELERSKTVG